LHPVPLLTSDHTRPRQTLAAGIVSRMTATAVEPSRAQIKLSEIVFDEGLYPRVDGHDPATVQTYARDMEQIEAAGKLISINADGILLDGRHRMLAYKTNADGGDPVVTVYRYPISSKLESFRLACELQDRGFALNNNDRQASAKRLYQLGDQSQAEIAKVLGVSAPTVSKWLSRTIKEEKEAKQKKAREMWLACATQQEIADAVQVPQQTVKDWTDGFTESCLKQESVNPPSFDPPIYNVWKQQTKSNAVSHFGNSEARWVENLLYLYTQPGSVVVDPFGGGGSTIDVCKKWQRRYYVSDRKPIVAREHEIRLHDLTTGMPSVPRWKDVDLVYLDPPYWKQAEGQYSDDPTDLANMPIEQFNAALSGIVKGFADKLKASAADHTQYIALIIQPTQWKAPDRGFVDHIGDMLRLVKLPVAMRYSVPYESQQCTAQMVEWAKAAKRCLVLTREIIVWEVQR
jgi:predicted transcriptional regulator